METPIIKKGQIILKPIAEPRKDWEKEFEKMRLNNDDKLLIPDEFDDEDLEE